MLHWYEAARVATGDTVALINHREHEMNQYISAKYLPPSLHLNIALVWWLYIDRYSAPGWVIGVLATLYAIIAIVGILGMKDSKAAAPVLTELPK